MRGTDKIINKLKKLGTKRNREGMARFGIETKYAFGVNVTTLRKLAKEIGKNHKLAGELWKTKFHEARILACFIDEPEKVTERQMDLWVKGFNSWDLCDQCCLSLFDKTPFAWKKVLEWVKSDKEFVRRAGFAMMAVLAVHDKTAPDSKFLKFFPIIKVYSVDERNFVKKAVNWALRQIGKRNAKLKKEAIKTAEQILKQYPNSKSAKWIANDALRELKK